MRAIVGAIYRYYWGREGFTMRLLDKLLTAFIYLWVGFAILCMVADIIWIIFFASPSIWSGLLAVQDKWSPLNLVHWFFEFIFVSPAIGAWFLREHLREKKAKSLGPTRGGEMANNPAAMDKLAALMGAYADAVQRTRRRQEYPELYKAAPAEFGKLLREADADTSAAFWRWVKARSDKMDHMVADLMGEPRR
jgi:hypothetical protein